MPTNSNYSGISAKQKVLHGKISARGSPMQQQKRLVSPKITNHRIQNPIIEFLSNQQKELPFRISSRVNNEKLSELKTQRNRILHDTANILNEDKNHELGNLASKIDKCNNDNPKMYQATKFVNRKSLKAPIVHDKFDRNVTEPNAV